MKKICKIVLTCFAISLLVLLSAGTTKAAEQFTSVKQTEAYGKYLYVKCAATSGVREYHLVLYSTLNECNAATSCPSNTYNYETSYPTSSESDTAYYTNTGVAVQPGHAYYLKVFGYDTNDKQICMSSAYQVVTKPNDPTNSYQLNAGSNSISVAWKSGGSCTGYVIRDNTSMRKIATNRTYCTFTNLPRVYNTSCYIVAYTRSNTGFISYSSSYGEYCYSLKTIPLAPKLRINAIYEYLNELDFAWDYQSSADGYIFRAYNTSGKCIASRQTTSSYLDFKGYKGKWIRARVQAYRTLDNGRKVYSPLSSYVYAGGMKNVKIKWRSSGIKLTWSKLSGTSKYTVYVSKSQKSGYKKYKTLSGKSKGVTVTKYGKKKLRKRTYYYIKIVPQGKFGRTKGTSSIFKIAYMYKY